MPNRPSRLRLTVVLALPLAATLGACNGWSRRPLPAPGDRFATRSARVIRTEGSPILLDRVSISADSLVGLEHAAPHVRVAIPLSEVRMVETRRVNAPRTAAVTLLSLIGASIALAAWALQHLDD